MPLPQPLYDRVLIRREAAETTTPGGLFIPEDSAPRSKGKTQTGVVEAVGHGRMNIQTGVLTPLRISVGDRVMLSAFAGTDIRLRLDDREDDKNWLVVREDEILAVIDP